MHNLCGKQKQNKHTHKSKQTAHYTPGSLARISKLCTKPREDAKTTHPSHSENQNSAATQQKKRKKKEAAKKRNAIQFMRTY